MYDFVGVCMNRKIVLSLAFVLVVSMFSGVTSCLADANVGVTVGLSYDYVSAISGTKRDANGTLMDSLPFSASYLETITVLQVSGTDVTIEFERDFMTKYAVPYPVFRSTHERNNNFRNIMGGSKHRIWNSIFCYGSCRSWHWKFDIS